MSSGPPRPFVSVKFSPVGRTYSFLLPALALDADSRERPLAQDRPFVPGDAVIVETPEGRAIGTVTRGIPAMADRRRPPEGSDAQGGRRGAADGGGTRRKPTERQEEEQ